jgi:hypothetical protein
MFETRNIGWILGALLLVSSFGLSPPSFASGLSASPEAAVCGPTSEPIADEEGRTLRFCAKWNPEFRATGNLCCHDPFVKARRGRKLRACAPERAKASFCGEMTQEQREYERLATRGELGDVLEYLKQKAGLSGRQDQCGPNNGFLAYGRPIVSTPTNRIMLRNPSRCIHFGTDEMAMMVEWLGRKVAEQYSGPEYSGVRVIVGDISTPRGGCIPGRRGRRGHSSHTSGTDMDLGFLNADRGKSSPVKMSNRFDAGANWWFLRNVLQNPFACVKRVFLDRRLIRAISRSAGTDPVWKQAATFIQHAKFHKNHFHVRLGDRPGAPGCLGVPDQGVELDEELDLNSEATEVDLDALDAEAASGPADEASEDEEPAANESSPAAD